MAFGSKQIEVKVGLDDNFRLTQSAGYLRAYKGQWVDDSTFMIDYQVVDYSERGQLIIAFKNENQIEGSVHEYVENVAHKISGQLIN